ncbi:MAG: phosphotransferase [Pseudomonadota bacterium]
MRVDEIATFLSDAGWGDATPEQLAGDASARDYLRLTDPDLGRAILMDNGTDSASFQAFRFVNDHLRRLGFSAPRILEAEPETGLMLLEDLGDALFARVLDGEPAKADALYGEAIDLLVRLHGYNPPPGLSLQTPGFLVRQLGPVTEWYRAAYLGKTDDKSNEAARKHIGETLTRLLWRYAPPARPVFVHRDYHAENLIWLPDRLGVARVGVLDFQDALTGHWAYDLISLLQDARRDLDPSLVARMRARYAKAAQIDPETISAACAVLGAQRNLRILGVFARLALQDGKTRYLSMMPRVWNNLQTNLSHDAMAPLQYVVSTYLSPPATPAKHVLQT